MSRNPPHFILGNLHDHKPAPEPPPAEGTVRAYSRRSDRWDGTQWVDVFTPVRERWTGSCWVACGEPAGSRKILVDSVDEIVFTCTIDEFFADNEMADEVAEWLSTAGPGDLQWFGGGAAGRYSVTLLPVEVAGV